MPGRRSRRHVKALGLIINPIAGMGGRVGLKGTDGPEVVRRARELGAQPESAQRAAAVLSMIPASLRRAVDLITPPWEMGEEAAKESGWDPVVVGSIQRGATTFKDTATSARLIRDLGADILAFAGGDGTARDICRAIGDSLPVVGIPTGVKMHSAVFAINIRAAADLIVQYFEVGCHELREAEVMDIDEEAFRQGAVSAELYGFMKIPYQRRLVQGMKVGSVSWDDSALAGIGRDIAERMEDDCIYIVGPGTTTKAIVDRLRLPKTLLGVDVICGGKLVAADVGETQLLELIEKRKAKIIVTPIGGQGYIFGRGNQQISAKVIRRVGEENIVVVCTMRKLRSLNGDPFLVDTGDPEVDRMLAGFVRVVTGYRLDTAYRIA